MRHKLAHHRRRPTRREAAARPRRAAGGGGQARGLGAELSPLQASDAEDVFGDWLDEHGIAGGWDLAGTLVAGGVDVAWLDQVAGAVGAENLEAAVRWLTYTWRPSCSWARSTTR